MIRPKPEVIIILGALLISVYVSLSWADDDISAYQGKKRDPFVALVKSDGKIKSWEELFPRSQEKPLSISVTLKAIIWDEERPLVLINKKIYTEGQEITRGIKVEKIHPNSVELNDSGSITTIQLRKTRKK